MESIVVRTIDTRQFRISAYKLVVEIVLELYFASKHWQLGNSINCFVFNLDGILKCSTSINCTNEIKLYINITFSILTFQQTFDQVHQRWL